MYELESDCVGIGIRLCMNWNPVTLVLKVALKTREICTLESGCVEIGIRSRWILLINNCAGNMIVKLQNNKQRVKKNYNQMIY